MVGSIPPRSPSPILLGRVKGRTRGGKESPTLGGVSLSQGRGRGSGEKGSRVDPPFLVPSVSSEGCPFPSDVVEW